MADDTEPFSPEPPPALCSERVLHYAVLDESVGYIAGHRLKSFDGEEMGKVPCLAICKGKETTKFTTYCCERDWEPLAVVSASDTVETAKGRAERIYPGSSAKWIEAHFTEEDVIRYLDEIWANFQCSFCGKRMDRDRDIESIVEARDGNARICDKCIAEFSRK
jgi:hypothetical protein